MKRNLDHGVAEVKVLYCMIDSLYCQEQAWLDMDREVGCQEDEMLHLKH